MNNDKYRPPPVKKLYRLYAQEPEQPNPPQPKPQETAPPAAAKQATKAAPKQAERATARFKPIPPIPPPKPAPTPRPEPQPEPVNKVAPATITPAPVIAQAAQKTTQANDAPTLESDRDTLIAAAIVLAVTLMAFLGCVAATKLYRTMNNPEYSPSSFEATLKTDPETKIYIAGAQPKPDLASIFYNNWSSIKVNLSSDDAQGEWYNVVSEGNSKPWYSFWLSKEFPNLAGISCYAGNYELANYENLGDGNVTVTNDGQMILIGDFTRLNLHITCRKK